MSGLLSPIGRMSGLVSGARWYLSYGVHPPSTLILRSIVDFIVDYLPPPLSSRSLGLLVDSEIGISTRNDHTSGFINKTIL